MNEKETTRPTVSEAGPQPVEEPEVSTGTNGQAGVPPEPDWDRVLRSIEGAKNSLAGWLRRMEGYDDEAMKRALSAAWNRPDPRLRMLDVYRASADRLAREIAERPSR
jgi:hypothetical protein